MCLFVVHVFDVIVGICWIVFVCVGVIEVVVNYL